MAISDEHSPLLGPICGRPFSRDKADPFPQFLVYAPVVKGRKVSALLINNRPAHPLRVARRYCIWHALKSEFFHNPQTRIREHRHTNLLKVNTSAIKSSNMMQE